MAGAGATAEGRLEHWSINEEGQRLLVLALPPAGEIRGGFELPFVEGRPCGLTASRTTETFIRYLDFASDGAGRFEVEHVPVGSLEITIRCRGHGSRAISVDVAAGTTVDIGIVHLAPVEAPQGDPWRPWASL